MPVCHRISTAVALGGLLLLTACGGSSPEESTGDATTDAFQEAARTGDMAAMRDAANASAEKARDEGLTIDQLANPERLRSFLPETLAGLQRNYVSTDEPEPNSPYLTSGASAMYGEPALSPLNQGSRSLDVSITDAGSMKSMLGMIRDGISYDRDGETARSFKHGGFLGLETTSEGDNSAELQLRLPARLLVSVTGRNIDVDQLHEALDQIDLRGLAGLAESGELATLTEWQTITLPSGEQLGAVLPETIGESERGDVRGNDMLDYDPPYVMANTVYRNEAETRRPPISMEVTLFKSADHAQRSRPGGREKLSQRFGGFDENRMEFLERDVHGVTAEVILWGSNAGVGRVQHDRTVIIVSGPADAEALFETLAAIDPAATATLNETDG